MNISQTKLQTAADTIKQIEYLASRLTDAEIEHAHDVKLWDPVDVLKTSGLPAQQPTIINLRNKLYMLKNKHGFTNSEVEHVAKETINFAIDLQDEITQFRLMVLDPMFHTGK